MKYEIWTDGGIHKDFNDMGCAAYIEQEGQNPYMIFTALPKMQPTQRRPNFPEFQAVVMALHHVGEGADVILHSDSKNAIGRIKKIRSSEKLSERFQKNCGVEIDIVRKIGTLSIHKIEGRKGLISDENSFPHQLAHEFASAYMHQGERRAQYFQQLQDRFGISFQVLQPHIKYKVK